MQLMLGHNVQQAQVSSSKLMHTFYVILQIVLSDSLKLPCFSHVSHRARQFYNNHGAIWTLIYYVINQCQSLFLQF